MIDSCKYHNDNAPEEIQKPSKSTHLMECGVPKWDAEYVNIEQEIPEVACMSALIENMVDDSGTDEEFPLPNVTEDRRFADLTERD